MDRELTRSATDDGPRLIVDDKSALGKYFAAAGKFFTRRKRNSFVSRRQVRTAKRAIVLDIPKTDEEVEQEELDELEAWHRMVHEVAVLNRERKHYEEISDRVEVENAVAEARALMAEVNRSYGWEPGEPVIADRMFGVNTRALLAEAMANGKLPFRTKKMIDALRTVAKSADGGRSRIAMVAAVRNLVGGVTVNEAALLRDQRRLKADDFAELVGMADRLSRAEEKAIAARLGRPVAPATRQGLSEGQQMSVADGRMLRRKSFSL